MTQFAYNPADGFKNTASFPNPTTQTGGREQLQSLLDQARDAINLVDTDLQDNKTFNDSTYALKSDIQSAILGQIPDASVTPGKLSFIAATQAEMDSHLADYVYQTAGGVYNQITLTISETLTNGFPITFIAKYNNNGEATIINGKSLYKPNTTTSPSLIAGKAYTAWYNSTSDCFFIKASAEGNTVAGHVLAGDTFSNDTDTGIPGTMPNNPSPTTTLTAQGASKVVPLGYSPGGTINVDLPDNGSQSATLTYQGATKNVPPGYTGLGGSIRVELTDNGSQSATLTNQGQTKTVPAGFTSSGGTITTNITNLVASNIINTAVVGGIQGTALNVPYIAGSVISLGGDSTSYAIPGSWTKCSKRITVLGTGSVRIFYTMQNGASQTTYLQLYKNGSAIGTLNTRIDNWTVAITYNQDFSCNAGDYFEVWAYSNQVNYAHVQSFSVSVAGVSGTTIS